MFDSQNKLNKPDTRKCIPPIEFKKEIPADPELKEFILEIYNKITSNENVTIDEIINGMIFECKTQLDKKYGENWIVIGGLQFTFFSSMIEDTAIGFRIGTGSFAIFRTHCATDHMNCNAQMQN
jgi:hypothetical protein